MGAGGGDGWLFLKARGRTWSAVGLGALLRCCWATGSTMGVVVLKERDDAAVGVEEGGRDVVDGRRWRAHHGAGPGAPSRTAERRRALLMAVGYGRARLWVMGCE